MAAGIVLCVCPFVVGVLLDQKFLPNATHMPLLDHSKSPGYEINYCFACYVIYLALTGLCATESYFVFHVVLSIGHLKMLQEMLSDLNDVIGSKDQNQKEERFKGKMTEFLFEHQEHFRLTRSFGELFSMHNFVMVVGASVIIVCSLVILVDEFWLLGFVMVFIGFWQILFITLLGTAYETSCEEFEKSTYSVNWYLLAPKQRKAWRLVIQMSQNPRSIPIGRIWKANLNSFIKVRGTAADN